jgi:hypothetical protein
MCSLCLKLNVSTCTALRFLKPKINLCSIRATPAHAHGFVVRHLTSPLLKAEISLCYTPAPRPFRWPPGPRCRRTHWCFSRCNTRAFLLVIPKTKKHDKIYTRPFFLLCSTSWIPEVPKHVAYLTMIYIHDIRLPLLMFSYSVLANLCSNHWSNCITHVTTPVSDLDICIVPKWENSYTWIPLPFAPFFYVPHSELLKFRNLILQYINVF